MNIRKIDNQISRRIGAKDSRKMEQEKSDTIKLINRERGIKEEEEEGQNSRKAKDKRKTRFQK